MLSHLTTGTSDLAKGMAFYRPLMALVGWRLKFEEVHWMGWMPENSDRPLFILTTPQNERPASAGNGSMVALECTSREMVTQAYDMGLRLGGTDQGEPGLRPQYHPDYFGAYLLDPDGNKLCFCCHLPVPA